MNAFVVHNLDELREVADAFVKQCPPSATYLVRGEMGAGKTTFIRMVCETMGASPASSPTFSLVHQYDRPGENPLFHFDLYRIRNVEEALDFGIDEYLDADAVLFIEWPEVIAPLLRGDEREIFLEDNNGKRSIRF